MKLKHKIIRQVLMVLILAVAGSYSSYAQPPGDNNTIKTMLETKRYVFEARTALPMRGRSIQLNGMYDLRISPDTVIAHLPYFGRAFSAPLDPAQTGIMFTSTDFTYKINKKKRGWDIMITPNDTHRADVRNLMLSISEDGYGSLRVNSTNRESISFSGYITRFDTR